MHMCYIHIFIYCNIYIYTVHVHIYIYTYNMLKNNHISYIIYTSFFWCDFPALHPFNPPPPPRVQSFLLGTRQELQSIGLQNVQKFTVHRWVKTLNPFRPCQMRFEGVVFLLEGLALVFFLFELCGIRSMS